MRRALAIVIVIALGGTAAGEPANLTLTHEPAPHHLRMRATRRAAAAASAPLPKPALATPEPPAREGPTAEPAQVRDLHDQVSARVNLGYVVDGAQRTTVATDANDHRREVSFQAVRAYGFGEGYLSTHGVAFDSLSTYFAGRFQLVHQNLVYDPKNMFADSQGLVPRPAPIATWFERSGFEPRSAWAEVKDFTGVKALAPLRVRAGEQYVYGPWVMHFNGVTVGWEGKLIRGTAYTGTTVLDYTLDPAVPTGRSAIGGASIRVDLRDLANPIPITFGAESLNLTSGTNTQPANHNQLEVDWRPRKDFALIATARQLARKFVNEHVQLRVRYHEVTNFVFDITHRASTDWQWDPTVLAPENRTDADPTAVRRYLDLGPVLPQLVASARAGTLIAENVDVYARGAIAADLAQTDERYRDTYSAGYLEGGGALEVRVRRTVALGASLLSRSTRTDDPATAEIIDVPNQPDAIPVNASSQMGERSFTEVGTTARLSLGARKFSLLLELYGRRTHYATVYCALADGTSNCQSAIDTGIQQVAYRAGGRAQIDAWIGNRLRLFASYDLSSTLEFTPEITGYKSLRLVMEGIY